MLQAFTLQLKNIRHMNMDNTKNLLKQKDANTTDNCRNRTTHGQMTVPVHLGVIHISADAELKMPILGPLPSLHYADIFL